MPSLCGTRYSYRDTVFAVFASHDNLFPLSSDLPVRVGGWDVVRGIVLRLLVLLQYSSLCSSVSEGSEPEGKQPSLISRLSSFAASLLFRYYIYSSKAE